MGQLESTNPPVSVAIVSHVDIQRAREAARGMANELGFDSVGIALIVSATFAVADNIFKHAHAGEIVLQVAGNGFKSGIEVMARDTGPGIEDVSAAIHRGYQELGQGLCGVRATMDEFQIESKVGVGTTVVFKKWKA